MNRMKEFKLKMINCAHCNLPLGELSQQVECKGSIYCLMVLHKHCFQSICEIVYIKGCQFICKSCGKRQENELLLKERPMQVPSETMREFSAGLLQNVQIDTVNPLQDVIDLIFQKAVDEPNFSVAYAAMCKELALMQVPTANSTNEKKEYVNFRKLIVTRCQMEFEKQSIDESVRNEKLKEIEECTDPERKKDLTFDLEEYNRKLRMKSVGIIRFIGELFKQQFLTVNIMMRCLDNLLTNKDEENLECLCKLLTTIGKELEAKNVNLAPHFQTMKEIVDRKHCKVSSRVRFMLQDVIDLRSSNWVPRRQDLNPKTIDQIQKEAENEQLNSQSLNAGPITPRKDDRNMSSNSQTSERKRNKNITDNEGWTQSSRNNRNMFSVKPDKLRNDVPPADAVLGCSNNYKNWSKAANMKVGGPPTSIGIGNTNMYAALEGINDQEKQHMGGNIDEYRIGQITYEKIQNKLIDLLKADEPMNDIINWITVNVGDRVKEEKFIRALATAVFEDLIINKKVVSYRLSKNYVLLQRFVDNDGEYEFQCLCALEAVINRLEHLQTKNARRPGPFKNAWRPARFRQRSKRTDDDRKTDDLYKKVRGILNKLTPQKYEILVGQVKNLQIDTVDRLQGVIDLVFQKAVDEPNFSVAYAAMCKELALMQVPTANSTNEKKEYVNFRKLILTRCQMKFEKQSIDESVRNEKLKEIEECTDPEKKKDLTFDLEEYDRKLRMKSVGNIRFIGELFKQQFLTVNIMMRCLDNLLTNKDEENLECLCKLLTTIGKELEAKNVNLAPQFQTMKEIVDRKHCKVSSRIRFMLQDVIDLRSSNWVPRRQDLNPKTLDQIQKEAENEQLDSQSLNAGMVVFKYRRLSLNVLFNILKDLY